MSIGPASRDAAPSLPQLWELAAPAEWRAIDFISDLHLQASQPRSFEAFAAHLRHTPADAVFILGDLFEAWVGDDARHDPFIRLVTGSFSTVVGLPIELVQSELASFTKE